MIEVCDASFSYGRGDFVLKGVSARLEPGERVVLLGLNGSGKSTLGRLLNGSLRPTDGSVSVDGQREGLARLVGYVRQDPRNQIVSPVVWDEVAFGPRNLGLPLSEVKARVDEALAACGISDLARRMTSELSGGQQQLLAMAGVIAMRPRYLVLDEVGSQLDEASRRRVAELVGRLVSSGVGVLEIAHSPEALFGASRAIVLSDGKAAWTGSPRDLLANPRALELSGFAEDALAQCLSRAVRAGYQMGDRPDAGEISSYLTEKDLDPAPARDSSAARELLEARDVSVSYESVEALSRVSLSAGGVSVLLGASGSGKTTLARILAGVLAPDAGRALVAGRDVRAGDVGLSFQRPEDQLFCDTVIEDISYGPRAAGKDDASASAAARRAARMTGVSDDLLERSPFELSGGQMRRVALAGVVAGAPRAYVFDEPTAGLDAPARAELRALVRSLAAKGRPVLVVTHDAGEWLAEADEVTFVSRGRLAGKVPAREAASDPEAFERIGMVAPLMVEIRRAMRGRQDA